MPPVPSSAPAISPLPESPLGAGNRRRRPGRAARRHAEARRRGGTISETVPRAHLWRAQTPQVFRYAALLEAHRAAASLGSDEATALTDDAAVAERAGLRVVMVEGHDDNRKITTPEDLRQAATMETRTAFGFDVHGFGPGNSVMLGGVAIPHAPALAGHSDADVALHALTDACWARSAPATSASISRRPIRNGAAPPRTASCATPWSSWQRRRADRASRSHADLRSAAHRPASRGDGRKHRSHRRRRA